MSIKAADVKKLRDATGAGMMDCKKALKESGGDMDAAIEYLRKKGQKVSEQRAERDATEGIIAVKISDDKKKAIALELNCETDFVARNDEFVNNADKFAALAFEKEITDSDELGKQEIEGVTVDKALELLIGKIGEKITINQIELLKTDGSIVSYIHPGSQLAVLVEFAEALNNEEVGRDVAMQVAAMSPIATNREGVDTSVLDKEREIAKEQLINEGKPEHIAEKAAEGKLRRFYEDHVLLEQKFVKDSSVSVSEYLKQQSEPTVKSFRRIVLGNH